MDWKALAEQQRAQIVDKDAIESLLRQQLAQANTFATNLQFGIVEHIEKLARIRADAFTADEISKSVAVLQSAQTDSFGKRVKSADAGSTGEESWGLQGKTDDQTRDKSSLRQDELASIQRDVQEPASLHVANGESGPGNPASHDRVQPKDQVGAYRAQIAALESQLAEERSKNRILSTRNGNLERQLQAEKSQNSHHEEYITREKDDEEMVPSNRIGSALEAKKKTSSPRKVGNIVKDRTPSRSDAHRTPVRPITTPKKRGQVTPSNVPTPNSASPSKRKRLADDSQPSTTPNKRAREHAKNDSSLADEIADLHLLGGPAPSGSKRVTRNEGHLRELIDFRFQAVVSYHDPGIVKECFSDTDLAERVEELWERIQERTNQWEELKGIDWQYEFTRTGYEWQKKQCVNSKLHGRRTRRREGDKGTFACQDCAERMWPCFIYDPEHEFLLLPLHEGDRVRKVTEGFETRIWLNDNDE